jgi:methyl-accepting chemotaxis protein
VVSRFEKYRCRGDELNDDFFNSRFRDIDMRLNALEQVLGDLQDAADTLLRIGIQRLNAAVGTAIQEFEDKAADIQETADNLQTLVTNLDSQVDALLATLGEEFHLDAGTF